MNYISLLEIPTNIIFGTAPINQNTIYQRYLLLWQKIIFKYNSILAA